MKTKLHYNLGAFILLLISSCNILAFSTDSIQDQDTSNLITFTLFPDLDPFQSDELIRIGLEFNMRKFIKDKYKDEYHNAILRYGTNGEKEKEIRIRARGEFRRKHCSFPPIKLNFKKAEFEEEYLNDIKTMKLVTHCRASSQYQQYILQEFLVYKMFNVLTDSSYRARLFEIEYIDSEGKMKSIRKYGFVIESNGHLAKRLNAIEIEREGVSSWLCDPYHTNLMTFFQFMVGNTDWAIANLHNIRLFKPNDHSVVTPLAIPYDFDYSGMIDTYYAIPDERLGTRSVRERVYRGYCFDSEMEYQNYFRVFTNQKKDLYELVENFSLLDKRTKIEMLQYLDSFFEIIENETMAKRMILDQCQTLPTH